MNRVVDKSIKIDLHIHSKKSSFKDGNIVNQSDINNISTLINALISNEVNLFAITDHDSFDYELYSKLKEQEKEDNCIKKVLPGVEFTVTFTRNTNSRPLHVIAIFTDEDDEKVKKIEKILELDSNDRDRPYYDCNNSFTEKKFLSILSSINLDTLLIVHQKQTLSSDSKPKQNDANSLGMDAFNEFVKVEYFEAFEFKNKKNEIFNNLEKQKYQNNALRFITGSDCHEWNVYPRHDSKSVDVEFKHTFIKSLPTFRGVAFALTDESRISFVDNFYTTNTNNFIDNINLSIKGKEINIPLSRGINAIIGDNSIGKSLLLHKLTNYYRQNYNSKLSPLSSKIVAAYDNYLNEKSIFIDTKIELNNIFYFDTQGEIRKKFNQGMLKSDKFFEDKYPLDVDVEDIKNEITHIVDYVAELISNKFEFDSTYNDIGIINLLKEEINPSALSILECDTTIHNIQLEKLKELISARKSAIKSLSTLLNLEISKIEKEKIHELIKILCDENKNVECEKSFLDNQNNIINSINKSLKCFKDERSRINSDENKTFENYTNALANFSKQISTTIKKRKLVKEPDYKIDDYEIKPTEKSYLNYIFVKKTDVPKVDKQYINSLLNYPFKKNKLLTSIVDLDKRTFIDMLHKYDDSEFESPVDYYKEKIQQKIKKDFEIIPSIVQCKDNIRKEYSDGVNAHVYFDIMSSNFSKNGIYLIDQPEDDVSPSSIKNYLLNDFKSMGRERQILLVTHNPQFVVNLDVDNVICITKSNENDIDIISGALEYKDDDVDIINTVSETLEGGIESIKKRWKRYEKSNNY